MPYFSYGQIEIDYLSAKDKKLGEAIMQIGKLERKIIPDLFHALMFAIIGQQISTKAQETIWQRLCQRFSELTPEIIVNASPENLQSIGISFRKVRYMQDIARYFVNNSAISEQLATLDDIALCQALLQFNGIGMWTAEMLMLFSLQRPNILSFGDLAILRGIRMLYRHRQITPQLFTKYHRRYTPYASTASLYLWAIANDALPELTDPAKPKVKKKKSADL